MPVRLPRSWAAVAAWVTFASAAFAASSATSVTPASGLGRSPTGGSFTFVFHDDTDFHNITAVSMDVSSASLPTACFVYLRLSDLQLYLYDDANGFTTSSTLGDPASQPQRNTRCAVDAARSSVSGSGTDLTVQLAVAFKAPLAVSNPGSYDVQMLPYPTAPAGWQTMGAWTVNPGDTQPSGASVSSSATVPQTFTFTYSDPDTPYDISAASVVIGPSLTNVGVCYAYVRLSDRQLYLAADNGVFPATGSPLGGAAWHRTASVPSMWQAPRCR